MKIAVCIKQVPARDWQPRLNDSKTWIRSNSAETDSYGAAFAAEAGRHTLADSDETNTDADSAKTDAHAGATAGR